MKFIYFAALVAIQFVCLPASQAQETTPKSDSIQTENGRMYNTHVKGNCEMCSERILNIANSVEGVLSSEYILYEQKLRLRVNSDFNETTLHYLVSGAGHTTSQMVANDQAYHNLPACCQYSNKTNNHNQERNEDGIVEGVILGLDENGKEKYIEGVNVRWLDSDIGIITDKNGYFSLDKNENQRLLQISHVAYQDEVIDITSQRMLKIVLVSNLILEEIGITAKRKTASISYLETMQSLHINKEELLKAACCSLAESFITTSSVDNTVSDAVTGVKKIEMLGLAGPYIMLTKENMPDIRGLSALSGFGLIPGPWVSSIQINPGSASVVNGYEGLTGQINVEIFKPDGRNKFMVDLFGNLQNRYEATLYMSQKLSDNIHTGVFFQGATQKARHDHNNDGFYDMPLHDKWMIYNRYKWKSPKSGWRGQFGVKYVEHDDLGGQKAFHANQSKNLWQSTSSLNRMELYNKAGTIFKNKPTASIGTQLKYIRHQVKSTFGRRNYSGYQESFYSNFQYQDQFESTKHKYRLGASFILDNYIENVDLTSFNNQNFDRLEWALGFFTEYTYSPNEKLNLVAGLRGDYHNLYKMIVTPRLNIRYAPIEETVFRLSVGKGTKTANIFAEQIGMFASNRNILIERTDKSFPYGLSPEVAWNVGIHYNQLIDLFDREHVFNLSFYRTQFQEQVIVDSDQSTRTMKFYNLEGESFSNSVQLQYETELIDHLNIRLAYRYNDVKSTYRSIGLASRPLISPHRAFCNLAYATHSNWKFDFTLNWISNARLPNSSSNPENFRWTDLSESYYLAFAHISKQWKNWEFFVGSENLFNYRQENPIISAENPYSPYFDASIIWGPVFGRNIYGGVRYTLYKEECEK